MMTPDVLERRAHSSFLLVLLEFGKTPGKFAVGRREPAILFESSREILQIAGGRLGAVELPDDVPQRQLIEAACLFVKIALLRERADHYTLLGLEPKADDQGIKAHYRLLMRLIHPDFAAANAVSWPADAATRVNLAYDVLSSPVQRHEYDERLEEMARGALRPSSTLNEGFARTARPVSGSNPETVNPHPSSRSEAARRRLRSVGALCGATGAVLAGAVFLMFDRGAPADLVQRTTRPEGRGLVTVSNPEVGLAMTESLASLESGSVVDRRKAAPTARSASVSKTGRPAPPVLHKDEESAGAKSSQIEASKPRSVKSEESVPDREDESEGVRQDKGVPAPSVSADPLIESPRAFVGDVGAAAEWLGTEKGATGVGEQKERGYLRSRTAAQLPEEGSAQGKAAKGAAPITMAEVQPLLTQLLHQMESGRGNSLLVVLDKDARRDPSTLAFASYYEGFVRGARTVRVSQVNLRPESSAGRLLMSGFVRIELGDNGAFHTKRLQLTAEFASHGGAVALMKVTGTESTDY